jgi:hypothetical protein
MSWNAALAELIRPTQLLVGEIELDNFGVKCRNSQEACDAGRSTGVP